MSGQVVDTGTAEEFFEQALQKISHDELRDIAGAIERKSALIRTRLSGEVTEDDLRAVLRTMFGMRRKTDALLERFGAQGLAAMIAALLDDATPVEARFDAFTEEFDTLEELGPELASELLHFSEPERYWLWTRWMWDPRTETGALRLVTMDEVELEGETLGETYVKVGRAVAFVAETGHAVGFTGIGAGTFGIDVFLACVYGIYMYTVLRMRMTQEFNHVVPELPELARRLLGVHRMEG